MRAQLSTDSRGDQREGSDDEDAKHDQEEDIERVARVLDKILRCRVNGQETFVTVTMVMVREH